MSGIFHGVLPAITTPFDEGLAIDEAFLKKHVRWLIESGCTGIVPLGSLGEGATLSFDEKLRVLKVCVEALGEAAPVVAGISSLRTDEAVALSQEAEKIGCRGLMVLPPYVYASDWREMKAHVAAVISATELSCMLYNNPVAYRTDFTPEHIAELAAEHPQLHAVKESSTDVRRVTAIRAEVGDRLEILVGVDDAIVEGVAAGATGWIAGLVNAFPKESVQLFELARAGRAQEAHRLYAWFLPLLRLDTVVKFVQQIKYVQEALDLGNARVRPPRLELTDAERAETEAILGRALAMRPAV